MHKFSNKSKRNLQCVHPDLIFLAYTILHEFHTDITIVKSGGCRTLSQQKRFLKAKTSKTLNSKHRYSNKCKAIDIVLYINNKPNWEDIVKYNELITFAKKIILKYDLPISHPIKWDKPHFQIKEL